MAFHRCRIGVRALGHDGRLGKVVRRWWRCGRPLETCCTKRIRPGDSAIAQRPHQIRHRNQVTHAENRRTRRRQDVEYLELRRISGVPAWHPEVRDYELRKE